MPTTLLLADDHAILRSGLQLLIESREGFRVVAQASDTDQAVALAAEHAPQIAIVDISMPGGGGVRACHEILAHNEDTLVITLTMHEDPAYLKAALAAGASGFVLKRSADTCLLDAIDTVLAGRVYLDPALGSLVLADVVASTSAEPSPAAVRSGLSLRERQVLTLLAYGYTNREAADELGLSTRSVETYRARMAEKLGFQSRKDMVRFALEIGLLHGQGEK